MMRRSLSGRWRIGRATSLALGAVVVAGCTVGPSARPPLATYGQPPVVSESAAPSAAATGPGGPGQQADPLNWGRCRDLDNTSRNGISLEVECGQLSVPLNYENASAAMSFDIPLNIARARKVGTATDAPPLVVVLGGPGSNGQNAVLDVAATMPQKVLDTHTIVTMDLRGASSGFDGMLRCFSGATAADVLGPPTAPQSPVGQELIKRIGQGVYFDCNDEVGPTITAFGSVNAADDLDSLRSALQVEKLQFLGRGFGATLGAEYAHRYPARVDRLVLDAPFDPQLDSVDAAAAQAAALERALDRFVAWCGSADDCALGADPAQTVATVVEGMDRGTVSARGQLLTGGSALLTLSYALGHPDQWPTLAQAIAKERDGDADALGALLRVSILNRVTAGQPADTSAEVDYSELPLEPQIAFTCNDSAQRLDETQIAAAATAAATEAPTFGPFLAGRVGLCASWPIATAPLSRLTAEGAAPILVIGSTDDPIAPYTGVKSLTNQLASAQLLSWQSGTHGAVGANSCVNDAVAGYLADATLPAPGKLCPP